MTFIILVRFQVLFKFSEALTLEAGTPPPLEAQVISLFSSAQRWAVTGRRPAHCALEDCQKVKSFQQILLLFTPSHKTACNWNNRRFKRFRKLSRSKESEDDPSIKTSSGLPWLPQPMSASICKSLICWFRFLSAVSTGLLQPPLLDAVSFQVDDILRSICCFLIFATHCLFSYFCLFWT